MAGGAVTAVTLVREGGGYIFGDVLSATDANLGASTFGAGFTVTVTGVRNVAINIYGGTTNTAQITPRIRLMSSDTSVGAGQELGTILFGSVDSSTSGRGDKVRLQGVAAGTSGGGDLDIYTSLNAGEPSLSLTVAAGATTFFNQIGSTRAGNTATGGGQIYLAGATSNRIDFSTTGVAAPAFTTRSVGTKLVLYPSLGATAADYAFGMDGGTLWSSVSGTGAVFKWYGGTTLAATLTGAGALTLVGGLTASGDITSSSDLTLKSNIEIITNALGKLSKIKGITFNSDGISHRRTGVIAQDVQTVLPEAVHTNPDGNLSVAYGNMIGLLVEAIKELNQKVKNMEESSLRTNIVL